MSKANVGLLVREPKQKKLAPAAPVELWEPERGEVRIRVEAAGQNPADWKQLDWNFAVPSFPFILGVDVAGVVDKLGDGVTKFKVGDRVMTMTHFGAASKHGVYQKYSVVTADATISIPDSFTFDQAATIPAGFWTAALGIFTLIQIPLPLSQAKRVYPKVEGEPFLVWGGSGTVGALTVQLAAISGFNVVATASPRNFEYVKSLGAAKVLDYHDADIVDQIRAVTPNLRYAFDAICDNGSTAAMLPSLSHSNPEAAIINDIKDPVPSNVKIHRVGVGAVYREEKAEERARLLELWDVLMKESKIKPLPVKIMPDGLNSIDAGFDLMRQGKVSGQKIVYHPWQTKI
ncbi:GroES-like protein [Dacryopinax primogenitus]|uniref:GroES-like protein n=1 Tax=Dacryopinax primogenitus (strain DJM 731) TaxID=1858805 RepID=M5FSD6_DACPD|nr:GroES-like protein [Dacryopinax primogenitus]EJT98743.1 GroES-like protein [Dacryopinax primogenitus]